MRVVSESIVYSLYVGEGDESEASGPPRDGVLHDHRVLNGAVDLEVLTKLL